MGADLSAGGQLAPTGGRAAGKTGLHRVPFVLESPVDRASRVDQLPDGRHGGPMDAGA